MMIRILFLSLLLTIWPAISTAADPLEQLGANNFDAVENYFSTLQAKFEVGEASEYDLLDAYKAFYQKEDKYRSQLNNWVLRYPKSSSAYLARGVYYRKLGEYRRGTKFISKVPSENIRYMEQMFQLAKNDLEISLGLNPKSYLTILYLLNIAQFEGDNRAADKYLALGNSVLPSNFLVRARYLIHLTPRWGGSYPEMEKYIKECQEQNIASDKIDLLNAIKFNDQGKTAKERGDIERARAEFQKALILSQSGGRRFRQDYLKSSLWICAESEHSEKDYCR